MWPLCRAREAQPEPGPALPAARESRRGRVRAGMELQKRRIVSQGDGRDGRRSRGVNRCRGVVIFVVISSSSP